MVESYFICTTPRSGSTLLCGLLQSTGVAGVPESYFRQPDEGSFARQWGIQLPAEGKLLFGDYLRAAKRAGSTANGVFGARIMWGGWNSAHDLVGRLCAVYPDLAGDTLALFQQAFGTTRYVYLQRVDVIGQAVSMLRAVQTNLWHRTDDLQSGTPGREARYDFHQIHGFVQE